VQEHFRLAQKELGFRSVRFHGIFNDEMFVINPDGSYNWIYVDEVFDFLLEIGLKPFPEFSFMPKSLASGTQKIFFYEANVTPPIDYEKWGALVESFVRHCVERYTLEEVASWRFEVWNEPDLDDFWTGTFEDYMRLYEISAKAVKAVSPELKIGGPAFSGFHNPWKNFLEKFLDECSERSLPVDFVSGHPYPVVCSKENNIWNTAYLDKDATNESIKWFCDVVGKSPFAASEVHFDEWNSSANSRDLTHDTAFMAPFIIHNYLTCQKRISSLCYWVLSDRFEEFGPGSREFHGGFGLLTHGGFKKPQYYAFEALRALGDEILEQGDGYVVTKSVLGNNRIEIQVLFWNYAYYNEDYISEKIKQSYYDRYAIFEKGKPQEFRAALDCALFFTNAGDFIIEKTIFDREHGSIFDFWLKNGALETVTRSQKGMIQRQCMPLETMEIWKAQNGKLLFNETVQPHGFTLIRINNVE
jgi:xylan 1,4-beta-xylosidase